jgi:subtilisin family serine protease
LYLANFSNIGQEMTCTGPGVGIVSTVPARNGSDAPYADMSGTSMAAPAVCALLATLLSRDDYYRKCPRDLTRPMRAYTLLRQALYPLGLNPSYQGGGLPHTLLAGHWN